MSLHLYTLSVFLNSTCFGSKKLSKSWGRKSHAHRSRSRDCYGDALYRRIVTKCSWPGWASFSHHVVCGTGRLWRDSDSKFASCFLNAGYRILVHFLISLPLIHKQWNIPFVARIAIFFTLTCRNEWGYQKQPNNNLQNTYLRRLTRTVPPSIGNR